jgi:hypothetical protein
VTRQRFADVYRHWLLLIREKSHLPDDARSIVSLLLAA